MSSDTNMGIPVTPPRQARIAQETPPQNVVIVTPLPPPVRLNFETPPGGNQNRTPLTIIQAQRERDRVPEPQNLNFIREPVVTNTNAVATAILTPVNGGQAREIPFPQVPAVSPYARGISPGELRNLFNPDED